MANPKGKMRGFLNLLPLIFSGHLCPATEAEGIKVQCPEKSSCFAGNSRATRKKGRLGNSKSSKILGLSKTRMAYQAYPR